MEEGAHFCWSSENLYLPMALSGRETEGKEVEKTRKRGFEGLPVRAGSGCRRSSGGSSGTALPPPGPAPSPVSAVRLGKQGNAVSCPLWLLPDKKSILSPWKYGLEMRVSGWRRFVSSLEINRKRRAERCCCQQQGLFWVVPVVTVVEIMHTRTKAPQGTPRDPKHCHEYQNWYWRWWHVIHLLLCHLPEPQKFWTASELISLKIFHPHHSAPIPSNSISIVTED